MRIEMNYRVFHIAEEVCQYAGQILLQLLMNLFIFGAVRHELAIIRFLVANLELEGVHTSGGGCGLPSSQ